MKIIMETQGSKEPKSIDYLKGKSWYRALQVVYGLAVCLAFLIVFAIAYENKPYTFVDETRLGNDIKRLYPEYENQQPSLLASRALIEKGESYIENKMQEVDKNYQIPKITVGSWFEVFSVIFWGSLIVISVFLIIRGIGLYILVGNNR